MAVTAKARPMTPTVLMYMSLVVRELACPAMDATSSSLSSR
jgi:hypothetical protein